MAASPALSNFAVAADELRWQEIARLSDALVPRIEALRSMTPQAFRTVIGLDPTVVSPPAISDNTPKPDVLGVENPPLRQYF